MPKINYKNNTITWDYEDFLIGLHPQYGVSASFFDGSYAEASFNPFRYLGYASPGENPTDCHDSDLIDGLIRAIEVSPTAQHGFAVGGTKVLDVNPSGTPDINLAFAIASNTMNDIVRYNKSDGTEYMFISYNGAASGDIARMLVSDLSHIDSYWQGTIGGAALSNLYNHPMIVGDDDTLYIGDGNIVRGLDGADGGTGIDIVLTLPGQYKIVGFSKLDNNTLIIVANDGSFIAGGKIGVFFWNYLDLDPYKSYYLDGVCGSIFNYQGTIAMVISSNSPDLGSNVRNTKIVAWNGSIFDTLSGSQIRTASLPLNKGVEVIGDAIYISINGTIYCYNSPFAGIKSRLHAISTTSGTSNGALKTISSGIQFAASNISTTNFYLQYYNGNYSTASWQGNNVDLYFPLRKKARIKRMRIEFKSSVSTAGRRFDAYIYSSDGSQLIDFTGGNGITTVSDLFIEKEFTIYDAIPGRFCSLYPIIEWTTGSNSTYAPIVKRIIVEYELVNI